MNIIGLGHTGCSLAKKLENYEQYKQYYVDVENDGYDAFYAVKHQNSHQDYEKNYKKIVRIYRPVRIYKPTSIQY